MDVLNGEKEEGEKNDHFSSLPPSPEAWLEGERATYNVQGRGSSLTSSLPPSLLRPK